MTAEQFSPKNEFNKLQVNIFSCTVVSQFVMFMHHPSVFSVLSISRQFVHFFLFTEQLAVRANRLTATLSHEASLCSNNDDY